MPIDPALVAILACPEDKGPLYYLEDDDALYNPRSHRRYRIDSGIPVMLIDEAEHVDETGHAAIMAKVAEKGLALTFQPDQVPPSADSGAERGQG